MSGLDIVLLVAALLFAISGFRQGFIVGVLSFAGFLGGGLLGIRIAPRVMSDWASGTGRALLAIGLVLGLAVAAQLLLAWIAGAIRRRIRWRPLRLVDSLAGAALSVGVMLVIAWFLASALRAAPLPAVARAIGTSQVLAEVDERMPARAEEVFGSYRALLDDNGFPEVFAGLRREPVAPVSPVDPRVARTAGIARAAGSVMKIVGAARACSREVEGSGFVVSPGRVITNAHVVSGVTSPTVQVGGRGRRLPARVVVYDPRRDLAVLAVDGLRAPALAFRGDARQGDSAVVAGFPRGGDYTLVAARVRQRIAASGRDVYGERLVTRRVLSVLTTVQPGNSGGPLLATDGRVYGVIFAKSLDDPRTGYALTAQESAPVVAAGRRASRRVDTGACTAD